jgi:DNA-binding NarL/FixJ family response regulator
LTRQLSVALPETRTVVLSFHEDANLVRGALAAGALANVVERAAESDLEPAIRAAAEGRTYRPIDVGVS